MRELVMAADTSYRTQGRAAVPVDMAVARALSDADMVDDADTFDGPA
jgi:hypothetical protein